MAFTYSCGDTDDLIAIARDTTGSPIEMLGDIIWNALGASDSVIALSAGPSGPATQTATAIGPGSSTVHVHMQAGLGSPGEDYAVTGTVAVTVRDVSSIAISDSDPVPFDFLETRELVATPKDSTGLAHAALVLSDVGWAADPPGIVTIAEAAGSPGDPLVVDVTGILPGLCDITVSGVNTAGELISATRTCRVAGAVTVEIS